MPMYVFVCINCKAEEKKLLREKELDNISGGCKICGSPIQQSLGRPESRSMETTDEYRGKTNVQGVDQMIEDRAKEHDRKNSKSV
jgi:bacteriocin-like protein